MVEAGGYPDTPPPGVGFAPPPGYRYDMPPGSDARFAVGDALAWSWHKFAKNALPLVVATFCALLILSAVSFGFYVLAVEVSPDRTITKIGDKVLIGVSFSSFGSGMLALRVVALMVVGAAILSAYTGGLLAIANGHSTVVSSFFRMRYVLRMIVLTLIVGVGVTVGYVLCLIPGVIVSMFAMFASIALIDRGLKVVDAIKLSVNITKTNFGSVFLVWLLSALFVLVGVLTVGLGLLVAGPVVGLLHVYTYRRLSGGIVAPQMP